jgi:hypothetical protein
MTEITRIHTAHAYGNTNLGARDVSCPASRSEFIGAYLSLPHLEYGGNEIADRYVGGLNNGSGSVGGEKSSSEFDERRGEGEVGLSDRDGSILAVSSSVGSELFI